MRRHHTPIPLNYSENLIHHIVNDTDARIILVSNASAKEKLIKFFNHTEQQLTIIDINDIDLRGESTFEFKEPHRIHLGCTCMQIFISEFCSVSRFIKQSGFYLSATFLWLVIAGILTRLQGTV